MSRLLRMMRCERGAVTIDWVVITAAVLLFGFVAVDPIRGGVSSLMESTSVLVGAAGDGLPSGDDAAAE